MNGQNTHTNNVINFNNKPAIDPTNSANEFNKQFTPYPESQTLDKTKRQTKRKFKQTAYDFKGQLNPSDVSSALKKIKNSKAMGPDNISIPHHG